MLRKKFPLFVFIFIIILVSLVSFLNFKINKIKADLPSASTDRFLFGEAWAGNLGAISFNNCPTPTSTGCPSPSYQVKVKPDDNTLDGWAWSQNAGWIQFGEGGDKHRPKPTLLGVTGATVTLKPDLSVDKITGWAKAVNGTPNSTDLVSNGWDGYISFGTVPANAYFGIGAAAPVAVGAVQTQAISGQAWGSTVVGDIDMSGVTVASQANPNVGTLVLSAASTNPVMGATAGTITVNSGSTITLSSAGTNLDTGILGTTNNIANWTDPRPCPADGVVTTYSPPFTLLYTDGLPISYTLNCTDKTGASVSSTVVINITKPANPPSVTLIPNHLTFTGIGDNPTFTWTTNNVKVASNACYATGGTTTWSKPGLFQLHKWLSNPAPGTPVDGGTIFGDTTYTITCTGLDGVTTASDSKTIQKDPYGYCNKNGVQDSYWTALGFEVETNVDCGGIACKPCDTNYSGCNLVGGVPNLTPQIPGTNCDIAGCPVCTKKPYYIEH